MSPCGSPKEDLMPYNKSIEERIDRQIVAWENIEKKMAGSVT